MRTTLSLTLLALALSLFACGSEDADYNYDSAATDAADDYGYDEVPQAELSDGLEYTSANLDQATQATRQAGPIALPNAADARKIIYNAQVQLVVDQFDGVPAQVTALAQKHGGFIASSNIRGSEGEPRTGNWTLRIPSAQYDTFITGAQTLGQVRELTSDSREVTAEYVDLEARVRNLKAEEERLHKHLDENTRSLKEILEVEREIARVRGESERITGRLNVLKDLTALSTVTLTIEEIKNYVPTPTEEPGFATQIARTWASSIDGVGAFLTGLSLATVGFVPWLVVVIPVGLIALLILRRLRQQLQRNAAKQTAS